MIAAQMNKRITVLRSARSFIDWQKRADFVRDLDLTRTTIAERIGQSGPGLALDLMWRFMALAEPVLNRVDDSNGPVGAVFRAACDDLGALAARTKQIPSRSRRNVFAAVTKNDYGEFDTLIQAIFPALGKPGITALKTRLTPATPKRAATDRFDSRAAAVRHVLQDMWTPMLCSSCTNGLRTDRLQTSSVPGTARSTATSTTCSIPRTVARGRLSARGNVASPRDDRGHARRRQVEALPACRPSSGGVSGAGGAHRRLRPVRAAQVFVSRLRARHNRKSGFRTLMTDPITGTTSRSERAERMLLKARQRPKGR
jgi:hypothetical protein